MSLKYPKFFLISSLILFSMAFFALPHKTLAITESSITVSVTPGNYAPSENVDIALSSFSANLDTVTISWFVNGRSVLSGIGKKSFSITSGAAGSETIVLARIALPDDEIQKTISIRPNVMVLLWQANDSYVPPFYKGKAMPTLESEIKVVAMPEIRTGGGMVDSKNMTYSWKRDYNNEVEGSGYGKNSFVYTSDYLENLNNIEVTASTTDQQYSSKANISVVATSPEISFYKKDNDAGIIWEHTLLNGHFIRDGEIIVAIPYFISPKDYRRPELVFNWFINDTLVGIQNLRKNLIPLRVPEGTSGVSKLRLEIENRDKIFQAVSKEIELQF